MGSPVTTDQPVRFGARTWRGVLAVSATAAVLACVIDLVFAYDLDMSDLAPAIWPICFVAFLLLLFGASVEWTITDDQGQIWVDSVGTATLLGPLPESLPRTSPMRLRSRSERRLALHHPS